MEIKNRRVEYPNRVRLNILQINRNPEGEIISIQAELMKDEGEVYEQGFALNEKNLNLLLNKYYVETLNDIWEQGNNTSVFYIDTTQLFDVECYLDGNPNNSSLNFTYEYVNNQIILTVTPNINLNVFLPNTQVEYVYHVLLKYPNTSNVLVELTGSILYIPNSTNPID